MWIIRFLLNPSSQFYASSKLSQEVTFLLWYELASIIRKIYKSIVNFYETFTRFQWEMSFSTSIALFSAWIAAMIIKIKVKTIKKYLQDLRSYHIDMSFDKSTFDDSCLERIIKMKKDIMKISINMKDFSSLEKFLFISYNKFSIYTMNSTIKLRSVLTSQRFCE